MYLETYVQVTNSICLVEKKYVQKEIDFLDETGFKQEEDFKWQQTNVSMNNLY